MAAHCERMGRAHASALSTRAGEKALDAVCGRYAAVTHSEISRQADYLCERNILS